jgi:hypothetical protein
MQKILVLLLLTTSFSTFAETDSAAIEKCLSKFNNHPFAKKNPKFRTIKGAVKVLGIGSDIVDSVKSDSVELILIKPSVSVIAKTVYKLHNPNGWYCMKTRINVISDTTVELDCAARFTTTSESITVIGEDTSAKGGVTVIGKSRIKRVNCKN